MAGLTKTADATPRASEGLGSCVIEEQYLVVHCKDDNNSSFAARDENGEIIMVGNPPAPWIISTGGIMSQGGGTMYGNAFLENLDVPDPLTFDRWLQHHEQVHSQQWAQYGWSFIHRYGSEHLSIWNDALYYHFMWGKVENITVPAICFNDFEKYAHFADGNYAMRWNERGGPGGFPQSEGGYPNTWLSDSHNPKGKCPATW